MASFGDTCRALRLERGKSQYDVAAAGGLEQPRVSEIERGQYMPGLDLAQRLAKGLGVTLTELVARWEGVPLKGRAVGSRQPPGAKGRGGSWLEQDVPQAELFRRVRGLWEDMNGETRQAFWQDGRELLQRQWNEEGAGSGEAGARTPVRRSRRR